METLGRMIAFIAAREKVSVFMAAIMAYEKSSFIEVPATAALAAAFSVMSGMWSDEESLNGL